jgi:integrase
MRRSEVSGLEWSSLFPDRIRLTKTKNGKAREIPLTRAIRGVLPPSEAGSCSKVLPHVRFHDLRHEWAPRYVEAGGDLVSLMEAGGWSSLALVQRYAKASHDRIRLTLEKMGNGTPDSTRTVSTADTIHP